MGKMKKMGKKIILILVLSLLLGGCNGEGNFITDILQKQADLVLDVSDRLNEFEEQKKRDYEYDDSYESENYYDSLYTNIDWESNKVDVIEDYVFTKNEYDSLLFNLCYDLTWIIYQENDEIILKLFPYNGNGYRIADVDVIDYGSYDYPFVFQQWRDYSNLVTCIEVGEQSTTGQDVFETSMVEWFADFVNLKSARFYNICIDKPASMEELFDNCHSLQDIQFINCDFSTVTCFSRMFRGCESLKHIDLSAFDRCQNIQTENMFAGCSQELEVITNNPCIPTQCEIHEDVLNGAYAYREENYKMFQKGSLTYIPNGSVGAFRYEENNTFLHVKGDYDLVWAVFEAEGNINLLISDGDVCMPCNDFRLIDYGCYRYSDVRQEWKKYENFVERAEVYAVKAPMCCSIAGWFDGMEELRNVNFFEISFSGTTTMENCFRDCVNLSYVGFNGDCDFSNVINVSSLFDDCWPLYEVDLTAFDNSNLIDTDNLFEGCNNLSGIISNNESIVATARHHGIVVEEN